MILRPVVEQAVSALLSDAELAALLSISRSWIRKERMRSGLPHSLTIDPVMVGRCPRYRASDVRAWLENSQATLSPTDR